MGTSNSKNAKTSSKSNSSKTAMVDFEIKTVNDFINNLSSFKGNNGPGDQFVGTFIVEWNKISKKTIKNESDILQGNRFQSLDKKYIVVLGKNKVLYIIDKTDKKTFKCTTITGVNDSQFSKIKTAWKKNYI